MCIYVCIYTHTNKLKKKRTKKQKQNKNMGQIPSQTQTGQTMPHNSKTTNHTTIVTRKGQA